MKFGILGSMQLEFILPHESAINNKHITLINKNLFLNGEFPLLIIAKRKI